MGDVLKDMVEFNNHILYSLYEIIPGEDRR